MRFRPERKDGPIQEDRQEEREVSPTTKTRGEAWQAFLEFLVPSWMSAGMMPVLLGRAGLTYTAKPSIATLRLASQELHFPRFTLPGEV